jgi:hypothetical protein
MTEALTRGIPCRACAATIYFLRTKKGHSIPVDIATVQPGDVDFDPARHVSHFATCSDPKRFRKHR